MVNGKPISSCAWHSSPYSLFVYYLRQELFGLCDVFPSRPTLVFSDRPVDTPLRARAPSRPKGKPRYFWRHFSRMAFFQGVPISFFEILFPAQNRQRVRKHIGCWVNGKPIPSCAWHSSPYSLLVYYRSIELFALCGVFPSRPARVFPDRPVDTPLRARAPSRPKGKPRYSWRHFSRMAFSQGVPLLFFENGPQLKIANGCDSMTATW